MKEKIIYPGAPLFKDYEIFNEISWLSRTTHCFAYAVGDYGAGLLTGKDTSADYNYLPRPGEGAGFTYDEIVVSPNSEYIPSFEEREKVLITALKQDGILFQNKSYPKSVPKDKYVICCFLEKNEYHFIRQNADGSWSSKNGYAEYPSDKCCDGITPIGDNPENFYGSDKSNHFVGYFFVPKGGVKVGIKSYLQKTQARKFKEGSLKTAKIERAQENFQKLDCSLNKLINAYRQKRFDCEIEDIKIEIDTVLKDIDKSGIDFYKLLKDKKMISSNNRIKRTGREYR